MNKFLRIFLIWLSALLIIAFASQLGYHFYKKGNLSWSEYMERQQSRYLVFKEDYPLIAAAREGDINQVKALLESGVDPNQSQFSVHSKPKDLKGKTVLEIIDEAIKIGKPEDSREEKIAVRDNWPLRAATGNNHPEIVTLLLEKGADVNLSDRTNETALTDAAFLGRKAIIPLLIKAGADINVKNSSGDSPITIAAKKGYDLIVQDLIAARADIKNGSVLARSIDAFDILLQYQYAYHLKSDEQRKANKRAIQMLIDAGAPVNSTEHDLNALANAAAAGREDLVELLLKSGADVTLKNYLWGTPLHAVAAVYPVESSSYPKFKESHKKIAQLLLDAGAPINAKAGPAQDTPLGIGVSFKNLEIARLLLQAGADPSIKNMHGMTALDRAKKDNFSELVELLEKAEKKK